MVSDGERAPDFRLTTPDEDEFRLSDKRGKVVALYFMVGWCGSCIPESQAWDRLYPVYKDNGFELLMVSADPNDTAPALAPFPSLPTGRAASCATSRSRRSIRRS